MEKEKKKSGKAKKIVLGAIVLFVLFIIICCMASGDDNSEETVESNGQTDGTKEVEISNENSIESEEYEEYSAEANGTYGARDYMLGAYKYINDSGASVVITVDDDSYYGEDGSLVTYYKRPYVEFHYGLTKDSDNDFERDRLFEWSDDGNTLGLAYDDLVVDITIEIDPDLEYIDVSGCGEDVFNTHYELAWTRNYAYDLLGAVDAENYLDGQYVYENIYGATIVIENTQESTYVWLTSGINEIYDYEGENYTWKADGSVLTFFAEDYGQYIEVQFGDDADWIDVWGADDEIYNMRFELKE